MIYLPPPICRPFNSIKFEDDLVIKQGINEQGVKLALNEISWYECVRNLGFDNIPIIFSLNPLVMKRVNGKNIFDYDYLTKSQKKFILSNIIDTLHKLHTLGDIEANSEDVNIEYIRKTFDRLHKVKELIPFINDEFIKINKRYYRNVLFAKDELENELNRFNPTRFSIIHGDCTFSNIMFDTFNTKTILIDPRGYFGNTKLYGDKDYDWAKIYYSLVGNYDQFNRKKFTLDISKNEIEFSIKPNNWQDMEEFFFDLLPDVSKYKIKLIHSIIWLSLTTYAWEDYDAICGAFYNGVVKFNEALEC